MCAREKLESETTKTVPTCFLGLLVDAALADLLLDLAHEEDAATVLDQSAELPARRTKKRNHSQGACLASDQSEVVLT